MKLLTAIATTALLIAAPSVNAGETWVKVTDTYKRSVKPGTIAEEFGWHGMAFYIDLQSIVTKGDITYYNDSWIPLNRINQPHQELAERYWDFQRNQPRSRNARQVNCATLKVLDPKTNTFTSVSGSNLELAKMACK
jgi:hypothetical protein